MSFHEYSLTAFEYRPQMERLSGGNSMTKVFTRYLACALMCVMIATTANASQDIFHPQSMTAARCGGTLYTGDPEYSQPYSCSLGHANNCMVQPLFYTTLGSTTETYHFHAAYHLSLIHISEPTRPN